MQIILDRVGKCDGCVHFTGKWESSSPCGGCERNPKVKNLRDSYMKPKALEKVVRDAIPAGPQDEISRDIEAANDDAMGEFGIKPAAHRRAARMAADEGARDGPPSSV